MNRLRDFNAVQDALDELDPKNAEKVTRLCINNAFGKLERYDREIILENHNTFTSRVTGKAQKIGEDGFIELLGKIGMYVTAYDD